MAENNAKTMTVSAVMHLDFAAADIWPLLCPVREYDWIETWECDVLHSESGVNELGCVFTTDFQTEHGKETWLTCRFDANRRLEFVRTNAARIIHFIIMLDEQNGATRMTWTQHVTALNETGQTYIEDKAEAFAAQMAAVEKMLAHYLKTGTMLRGEHIGLQQRIPHVHSGKTG